MIEEDLGRQEDLGTLEEKKMPRSDDWGVRAPGRYVEAAWACYQA